MHNAITIERGQTQYQGATPDASNLQYEDEEGKEGWFDNIDPSTIGTNTRMTRNNKRLRMRLVRNISGGALIPGASVSYAAGYHGLRVVAGTAAGEFAGIIDDCLPAAGCPDDDLCLICIEGDHLCNKTSTDVLADQTFLDADDASIVKTAVATAGVLDPQHVGRVIAAAGNPSAQVLAYVKASH